MSPRKEDNFNIENDEEWPSANPYHEDPWTGETPTETAEERQLRIKALQEAEERSRKIDEMLLEEKKKMQRSKARKILLLGQADSGKSSVIRNLRLQFAPKHFQAERALWKTVVYLNMIATLRTILDALREEYQPQYGSQANSRAMRLYHRTQFGLEPVKTIEANILALLAPECKDLHDMVLRAGWSPGWNTLLDAAQAPAGTVDCDIQLGPDTDPSPILVAQKENIEALWRDNEIQHILSIRRPHLRDLPGFRFMDDISRILTTDYVPTDSDVLWAKIKTKGVEEYYFCLEQGALAGTNFHIIDVGGSRSQRNSWASFCDDVDVIVFLAPLLFNQFLEEDLRVNRVEDSMLLWTEMCQNKLLARTHVMLFFTKMDVLAETLRAGIQVKKYIPSYKDLPNDISHVTKYFREKFHHAQTKYSSQRRAFICHEVSAMETNCMGAIIHEASNSVVRRHLQDHQLI